MLVSHSTNPDSLDVHDVGTPVEIEIDRRRGVVYVHIEGYSVLRVNAGAQPIIVNDTRTAEVEAR